MYPFPLHLPVVPASDGAGEVVAVGSKVTRWKKGSRVTTLFNQGHQFGPMTEAASKSGLGGVLDGTLRQYGTFNENGLVKTPDNLSDIEAATLPCAAVTSWNALYGLKPLKPGQTVLVQGTGGVSLFALQVCPPPSHPQNPTNHPLSSPKPPAPASSPPPRPKPKPTSSSSSAPTTSSTTSRTPSGARRRAS